MVINTTASCWTASGGSNSAIYPRRKWDRVKAASQRGVTVHARWPFDFWSLWGVYGLCVLAGACWGRGWSIGSYSQTRVWIGRVLISAPYVYVNLQLRLASFNKLHRLIPPPLLNLHLVQISVTGVTIINYCFPPLYKQGYMENAYTDSE